MRVILFFLFYGLLSSTLGSTVLSGFPFDRFYSVDLCLIAVASIAFDEGIPYKVPSLFVLGAFRDVSSTLLWGTSFLSFLIVLSAFRFLNRTISLHHGVALGVWTAVISLLNRFIISIVLLIVGSNATANNVLVYAIPQAIGDGLLSVITIPYFIKLINFLLGEKVKHSEKIGVN